MTCRPRRWTLSSAGLIGAAFAAMMLGTIRDAEAQTAVGCDITAGNATHIVTSTTNASAWTGGPQPFTAGDIITVSLSPYDSSTGVAFGTSPVTAVAGVQSFTYVIPSSANYNIFVSILDPNNLTLTVSFSCTHGSGARSLQNSITTTVATTSAQTIANSIDGGINDAFSPNGTPTNFGPNGGFINFASPEPKSQTVSRADEAFAALGYAGNPAKAPNFNKAPPPLEREWSAWADIRGTGWKANDTTGNGNDVKGNQVNLTAGLGRKLNTDTLVGVVMGYEYFKYDVSALAGSLKGDGETVGGYFARRFESNLRFDAALAWSNVNYNATTGTATGSFRGSRWLATAGLTGNYNVNVYVIEPSAKVYMLWEGQRAWVDSLGTAQDSRNFSAGRTALGTKVARPFEASNGWKIAPYAGLYGDWRFQTDSALPTGTPVANIGTSWSGRVTGGVSATTLRGATVSVGGEYGGLGANYKIWTGNVSATMPF